MKRWLPWLAVPLCLLAFFLSIFRPGTGRDWDQARDYYLRGPGGHQIGVSIRTPNTKTFVCPGYRVQLYWLRQLWGWMRHAKR